MSTVQLTVTYRNCPGHPGYRVGDDGSVWSCRSFQGTLLTTWHRLKPHADGHGHLFVRLCNLGRATQPKVHRLVLEAFVGPRPEGLECCHNNGDHKDNRLVNLRWDTHQSNVDDSIRHGTYTRGERIVHAKLTAEKVRAIRARYAAGGITQLQLAGEFQLNRLTILRILQRQTWKHVV